MHCHYMNFSLRRHNGSPPFWLKVSVINPIPSVESLFEHSQAVLMFLSSFWRHDVLELIKMCGNLYNTVEV